MRANYEASMKNKVEKLGRIRMSYVQALAAMTVDCQRKVFFSPGNIPPPEK